MTVSCYSNCCPTAPSITINTTNVLLDGNTTLWHDEYFTVDDAEGLLTPADSVFQLDAVPVSDASVQVFRGATTLRYLTDFTLDGAYLTLTTPLTDGEQIAVRYVAVTGVSSTGTRGTIVGFAGAIPPSGWLIMESTTAYAGVVDGSTYHALYDWLHANLPSGIDHEDATNFYLKDTFVTMYVGGVFQTVSAIIKT